MTTLKQFLAELTFIQIKEISRHAKGLLIALEKTNRKDFLDDVVISHAEIDRTPPVELYDRLSQTYNYEKLPLNSRS